ncbi:MAG: hypothetical protein AB1749_14415 [Pseudomonadota bacterium]
MSTHRRRLAATAALAGVAAAVLAVPAAALDELGDEKQRLKACERDLCEIILTKEGRGKPLACGLTKTWGKADIAKGASSKKITWSSGDARCSTSVQVPRRIIVAALTQPKFTLHLPQQTIDCQVEEDGKPAPLKAVASPKVEFKAGKAEKVWINLKELEGPSMLKGLIWATAKLEDSIGIFHSEMIKSINKFVHQKCTRSYPELDPVRAAEREQRRQQRRAARAAEKAAETAMPPAAAAAEAPGPKPATTKRAGAE